MEEAYLKALMSTGFKLPMKGVLIGVEEAFEAAILEVAFLLNINGLTVKFLNILSTIDRNIMKI